ncbi:MAG: FmdE family protein [Desulforhopalus sp.]
MKSFEELLKEATTIHGHVCAGQVIGVRMCMLALSHLKLQDPKGIDRKKLYVFVEIDRCATDAIQTVTGCSLGKRSMKWVDHGVMAATFVNLESGKAVRVTALEEARESSKKYCNDMTDKYARQLEAYKIMPDDELFRTEAVAVDIPPENLPGRPLSRVRCEKCSDWVQDKRDVLVDGKVLCKSCAHGRYYSVLD